MRAIAPSELKNVGLRIELENDEDRYLPPQAFATQTNRGLDVEVLWYPCVGRVGVATNGDPVWGDALTLDEVESFITECTKPHEAWDYDGYWNVVIGPNKTAADVVDEFDLDPNDSSFMESWLHDVEVEACLAGNYKIMPEEWEAFRERALNELAAVERDK